MTGFLHAGGKRLEYALTGPAPQDAPTLVLLHEGLGSMRLWRDFPARLVQATGWGVCVWSRAGYGFSDPADLPRPLHYMTHEARVVLPQVLAAIRLRSGVLVGHSDGATIAAVHLGQAPDPRLRGGVLMAPHFYPEPMGLAEIARADTAFRSGDLAGRMARHHADATATFRGWADVWLDPGFRGWSVAEAIPTLNLPVLAIQGVQDEYGTLAQIDALAAAPAPVTRLILDPCRHAPHFDRPDAVVAAIAAFCAGLP